MHLLFSLVHTGAINKKVVEVLYLLKAVKNKTENMLVMMLTLEMMT